MSGGVSGAAQNGVWVRVGRSRGVWKLEEERRRGVGKRVHKKLKKSKTRKSLRGGGFPERSRGNRSSAT